MNWGGGRIFETPEIYFADFRETVPQYRTVP